MIKKTVKCFSFSFKSSEGLRREKKTAIVEEIFLLLFLRTPFLSFVLLVPSKLHRRGKKREEMVHAQDSERYR